MIRVGLIGYGYWGPKLARCLAHEAGCELRVICDLSGDRLVPAAKDHPDAEIERDWRRLVANPALDAIVIATPAGEHFAQASAALEAGKHVLVEKPMALSSETALVMIESARHRHLVLLVDHTYVQCGRFNRRSRKGHSAISANIARSATTSPDHDTMPTCCGTWPPTTLPSSNFFSPARHRRFG